MSIDGTESRRPRRVVVAGPANVAPTLRAVPLVLGARFQRELGTTNQAPQHKAAATDAKAGGDTGSGPRAESDSIQQPKPSETSTEVATGAVLLIPPANESPPLWVHETPAAARREWEQSLARVLHRLCSSADLAITHWTIQVPLDPAALPETTLHLSLSPQRLQLRFNTQSAWSLRLLSIRKNALVQLLHETLPDLRDIDVELT